MKADRATGTIKVTISMPSDVFDRLEQDRRRRRLTRSALFSDLAARHLRELEVAEEAARYETGYAEHPESGDDLAWVADAGAATLAAVAAEDSHDWSEDDRLEGGADAAG